MIKKPSDFSFHMDRTGKPIVTSGAEHVRAVVTRLFGMLPGTDEYNPEMGLDLIGRRTRTYVEMTRDTEYETMIKKQLTTYTDLVPIEVSAVYMNKTLIVSLTVQYFGDSYTMQLSSELDAELDTLTSKLINRNDFNVR